jgi:hypothetical protein
VWGSGQRACHVFERRSRARADCGSDAAPRGGATGMTDGSAVGRRSNRERALNSIRRVEHRRVFASSRRRWSFGSAAGLRLVVRCLVAGR